MWISELACRIPGVLSPSGLRAKAAGRAMLAAFMLPVAAAIGLGPAPAVAQEREQVSLNFDHALPNVEGKRMVVVTVSYPPGGGSLAHRHAGSAFIYAYVLSGAVRSQVGDEPVRVYRAGEGFYELPGAHHRISENASESEPASLLAVFIVDSNDGPLTAPDKPAESQ